MVRRPSFYGAMALSFAIAVTMLIPRWSLFGVIYESKITHVGIVGFYFDGATFYWKAVLAFFSWPVVILALIGIRVGIRQETICNQTFYLVVWMLAILGFFALFYQWLDIRFVVYLSAPVFALAAISCNSLIRFIWYKNSLHRLCRCSSALAFLCCLVFYDNFRQSASPFEKEIVLTPTWSAKFKTYGEEWEISEISPKPFFYLHARESHGFRAELTDQSFDIYNVSLPLLRLMKRIAARSRSERVLYFESVTDDQLYFIRNRNSIYLRSRVDSFNTVETLLTALRVGESLLVIRAHQLAFLRPCWQEMGKRDEILFQEGTFAVVSLRDN